MTPCRYARRGLASTVSTMGAATSTSARGFLQLASAEQINCAAHRAAGCQHGGHDAPGAVQFSPTRRSRYVAGLPVSSLRATRPPLTLALNVEHALIQHVDAGAQDGHAL